MRQPQRPLPTRRLRLGFSFEGVFRSHMIVKGRNRDTAWYAMTDDDWGWVRLVVEEWLAKPDPKPSLSRLMNLAREGLAQ